MRSARCCSIFRFNGNYWYQCTRFDTVPGRHLYMTWDVLWNVTWYSFHLCTSQKCTFDAKTRLPVLNLHIWHSQSECYSFLSQSLVMRWSIKDSMLQIRCSWNEACSNVSYINYPTGKVFPYEDCNYHFTPVVHGSYLWFLFPEFSRPR